MKSLSGRRLVTLDRFTAGEIVEAYGELGAPGIVMVTVQDELFLIWKRDLEERAELLRETAQAYRVERTGSPGAVSLIRSKQAAA